MAKKEKGSNLPNISETASLRLLESLLMRAAHETSPTELNNVTKAIARLRTYRPLINTVNNLIKHYKLEDANK